MTDKGTKGTQRLSGVTSFAIADDDYIAPPPREIREHARAGNAALGFLSDKPGAAAEQAVTTAEPPSPRKKPPRLYPDHYNIRLRIGDRQRFDDLAYRLRIAKGEMFGKMLDLAEAAERNGELS